MEISTYFHEKDIVVLKIKGVVDAYTAQELHTPKLAAVEQGHHRFVLDVSNLLFISSAGIREILILHKEAVHLGGGIRITGPTDRVRRVFEISGLFELLHITDGLQESINDW